ncbi:MAG: helix-turn-helix transcriptional regulator [Bacilli bacterium]
MDKISNRISKAMKIRSMKQVDLARETGINKSAISSYLNDKYSPKQDSIYLLSKALNVSEVWLMGLSDNMERKKVISNNTPFGTENEIKDYLKEEPELWETYKKVYSSDTLRILLDGAKDLTPEDLKPILMLIRGIRKDKGLD